MLVLLYIHTNTLRKERIMDKKLKVSPSVVILLAIFVVVAGVMIWGSVSSISFINELADKQQQCNASGDNVDVRQDEIICVKR